LSFHDAYWDDLAYWIATDPRITSRLIRLTRETILNPFDGIGKPERLKYLESTWSRRITEEHRLIYRVTATQIEMIKAVSTMRMTEPAQIGVLTRRVLLPRLRATSRNDHIYLFSSPVNAERLRRAIESSRAGRGFPDIHDG
jgi:toxin YoeB